MLDTLRFDIAAKDAFGGTFAKLRGELSDVKGLMAGFSDMATRAGRSMRNLGAGLTVGLTTPIVAFGTSAVQDYWAAEEALTAVSAAVKSTEGAAGLSVPQLQYMAQGLQEITAFDGDDVLRNVTTPLLTFTKVTGNEFDKAQLAVLDMSQAMDVDLQSAAMSVGKALNDPVKGMASLGRQGVQFTKAQKDAARAMMETGDIAGAQAIILAELEKQFGGQAEAYAKTSQGQWKQLGIAVGDVKEAIGEQIVPFLKPLVEDVKKAVQWFGELDDSTKKNIVLWGGAAAALGPVITGFGLLTMGVAAVVPALAGLAVAAGPALWVIGMIAGGAYLIYQKWDGISGWFSEKWAAISGAASAAWEFIATTWNDGVAWFRETGTRLVSAFGEGWGQMISDASAAWEGLKAYVGEWVTYFHDLGGQMMEALQRGLSEKLSGLIGIGAEAKKAFAEGSGFSGMTFGMDEFGGGMFGDTTSGLAAGADPEGGYAVGHDLGRAAIDGANDALDRHSPSREFIAIGQDVTAGLGLGIQAGTPGMVKEMDSAAKLLGLPLDGVASQLFGLGGAADQVFSKMGGWLADLATGATTLGQTLQNTVNGWANSLRQSGIAGLQQNLVGAMGPIGGGLFGGFLGGLLSFEGGGYTGDGPRSGGVDGRGGFPAVLHPGETVLDPRAGGAARASGGGVTEIAMHLSVDVVGGDLKAFIESVAGPVALRVVSATFDRSRQVQRRAAGVGSV